MDAYASLDTLPSSTQVYYAENALCINKQI